LNADLCHAIAALGHGDVLLVVDAGFPIPRDAWRIDLAVAAGLPDLRTVLDLVGNEMIVEGIVVADEVKTHNAPLHGWLSERWSEIAIETVPHTDMLSGAAARAKAVVRTGAFDPWGNVLLRSGVDVAAWFADPGVVVPDYYRDRMGR
jgi:D-ribose pyranose/furanose isomerase RbsD